MPIDILEKQRTVKDFKDITLEKRFLGGVICNRDAFIEIYPNFDSNVLTSIKIKKIYDKIVDVFVKDKQFINTISLVEILNVSKSQLGLYRSLWKTALRCGRKKHSVEYLYTCKVKLESYYNARIIELGMRESLKFLTKAHDGNYKDIDKACETINKLNRIVEKKPVSTITVEPISNFDLWLKTYENKQENPEDLIGIPTGIRPIDERITGLRNSELGLIITESGVGKSIFLLDCAIHCWKKYGDVLYFTIEMPADQLEDRFWCNVTKIPYDKFRKLTLNSKDKKIIKRKHRRFKEHDFNFCLVDMPEGCTINNLSMIIEQYMDQYDLRLVVIDYLNILSTEKSGKVELEWQSQVELAMHMKQQLARKFKLPIWSGCQTTGDNIAFSRHIKDNIDIGIMMEEDEDTGETDVLDVSYPKTRDFKGGRHKLTTDRGCMTMYAKGDKKENELINTNRGLRQ